MLFNLLKNDNFDIRWRECFCSFYWQQKNKDVQNKRLSSPSSSSTTIGNKLLVIKMDLSREERFLFEITSFLREWINVTNLSYMILLLTLVSMNVELLNFKKKHLKTFNFSCFFPLFFKSNFYPTKTKSNTCNVSFKDHFIS